MNQPQSDQPASNQPASNQPASDQQLTSASAPESPDSHGAQLLEQKLQGWFARCPGAVVAFSGGVDSAVVAKAAFDVLKARAIAATADSASLARVELTGAVTLAALIGIEHRLVTTGEVSDPAYLQNDAQRCFHCKSHLFQRLQSMDEVRQRGWWILTGTNRDDLGDWRPGLQAASQHGVHSPLADLRIDKAGVRALAARWQLPVADKPASPCLASRVAYGVAVTAERLSRIEAAEAEMRSLGFTRFRVRLHDGELARIEVPLDDLPRLVERSIRERLIRRLGDLGFRFVTLDMEGFASGSLNRLIEPFSAHR